ncbi:MAG: transposase [Chloroflexi bacterium]|nr:transposase [Chloroflexota bacterium]
MVCFDQFGPISLQPYPGHCYARRKRPWRRRATYTRRQRAGYFLGGYDVHDDLLFGSYGLAKTSGEVLAFYQAVRRRYPRDRRIYLVNDNLSLHWTPAIRVWASDHNVELVPTPTYASYLNRIECHFQPLRELVINASDYATHTELASAFRRYLYRRNVDHDADRIRLLESRSRVA